MYILSLVRSILIPCSLSISSFPYSNKAICTWGIALAPSLPWAAIHGRIFRSDSLQALHGILTLLSLIIYYRKVYNTMR
jgi:hypothetical protein